MNAAGTGFQTQYANWRLEPWAGGVEVAAPQQGVAQQHQQETVKSVELALVVQVPTSHHRSVKPSGSVKNVNVHATVVMQA